MCHHGDFYTCDDRYNPGKLQNHKWENCMTIDSQSWGYRRNAKLEDYLSVQDLISSMVETVRYKYINFFLRMARQMKFILSKMCLKQLVSSFF